jgi:outer membrane protein OmpA-like peptidoglycan-associated protein
MKKVLQGATALAAIMIAGPAFATEGWYGKVDAGYGFDGSLETDRLTTPAFGGDLGLDNDWMEDVGIGYGFSNGFRLEGEIAHRYNAIEGGSTVQNGGNTQVYTGMINALIDLNQGGAVQPYFGVGVGIGRVDANAADGPANSKAVTAFFDDSDTALAYQGLLGLGFKASEQLTFDVGYRYMMIPNLEFAGRNGAAARQYEADYKHQAVTVGLRWQFAAPPPPVVEAPPPVVEAPPPPPVVAPAPVAVACPTTEFKVYFEWDRSNLNQAALDTIDAAVNQAKACNVSGVLVIGHTDTSGSPTYNVGLSQRRASVVSDALVSRGIAGTAITSDGKGEAELDRATRDGVREPLNRRTVVTITFQP